MNENPREPWIEESRRGVPAASRPVDVNEGVVRPFPVAALDPTTTTIALSGPPTPLLLLAALQRRSRMALVVGPLLAAIVAGAVWWLLPAARYTARASLLVAATPPRVIFKTEENKVDFATYQKTQKVVVKSRVVLEKALKKIEADRDRLQGEDRRIVAEDRPVAADPRGRGGRDVASGGPADLVPELGTAGHDRLLAVLDRLQAVLDQGDPVLWLEKRVQADYQGEVFQIAMSGDHPDVLAILVNAIKNAYHEHVVEAELEERHLRRDQLRTIYQGYESTLEQKRGELKTLTQKVGTKDKQTLQFAQQMAIEQLSTVRRELFQIQSDLRRARAELESRVRQEPAGPVARPTVAESSIASWINEDVEVKQLRAQVLEAHHAVSRVGRLARNSFDPAMVAALKDLETRKAALANRLAVVGSLARQRPAADGREGGGGGGGEDAGVTALRDRVAMLEELSRVTQAILDAQAAENQEISQDTLYIDGILDEIHHADTAAQRIGEELEILRVELKAPPRVRSLEPARPPRENEEKRLTMAGLAGLGSLGVFLLGVALVEFRARRISTVDEVSQGLGLRVMGALPPVKGSGRRIRRTALGPDPYGGQLLTESIDSIRTMILHSNGGRSLRTIMVTSGSSGEGKTSLACHLATSLARSGMKTLLIDGDLRKPTIHRLFDIPAAPGFSEFLRGEVNAEAILRTTTADGPDLITAGHCDARTLRALARASSGAIFEGLHDAYDIIVLDTSPILPVTDGLLVGRHVDAAVYSILNDVSRFPWTLAALGRLQSLNVRILGAVVTGTRSPVYGPYDSGLRTED